MKGMEMKKYLLAAIILILAMALSACAKKTEEESAEEALVETAETEETVDPMVMIMDDSEYAAQLGIAVDTTKIPVEGMGRYIVDGEIVYFCFGVQEGENAPVSVLLRATKNAELKDTLSGISGAETPLESIQAGGVTVERKDVENEGLVFHQYAFEKDGIYYCMIVQGEISEELFQSLLTSFMEAVRTA